MKNKTWLSAHLYYSSNLHKFLVKAVKPFKETVMKEGLAENYFFIRYWEKGSHIRLRFKGNSEAMNAVLKPRINEYFENYFSQNPSIRTEDKTLEEEYVSKGLYFPSNSIQYIEYEPEIERYGGEKGILVSEKLFEMSSNASFEILSNTDVDDYESTGQRAIGAAIQLHLASLMAFRYSKNNIVSLFEEIFNDWVPSAYKVFSKSENATFTKEEIESHKKHMIEVFNQQADLLKPVLKPFINDFIEALGSNCRFEEDWINIWSREMKEINTELTNAINNDEIITPKWFKSNLSDNHLNILNYLQKSYIHMTNNRVGVLNHNESFIAYLIKEHLKDS